MTYSPGSTERRILSDTGNPVIIGYAPLLREAADAAAHTPQIKTEYRRVAAHRQRGDL